MVLYKKDLFVLMGYTPNEFVANFKRFRYRNVISTFAEEEWILDEIGEVLRWSNTINNYVSETFTAEYPPPYYPYYSFFTRAVKIFHDIWQEFSRLNDNEKETYLVHKTVHLSFVIADFNERELDANRIEQQAQDDYQTKKTIKFGYIINDAWHKISGILNKNFPPPPPTPEKPDILTRLDEIEYIELPIVFVDRDTGVGKIEKCEIGLSIQILGEGEGATSNWHFILINQADFNKFVKKSNIYPSIKSAAKKALDFYNEKLDVRRKKIDIITFKIDTQTYNHEGNSLEAAIFFAVLSLLYSESFPQGTICTGKVGFEGACEVGGIPAKMKAAIDDPEEYKYFVMPSANYKREYKKIKKYKRKIKILNYNNPKMLHDIWRKLSKKKSKIWERLLLAINMYRQKMMPKTKLALVFTLAVIVIISFNLDRWHQPQEPVEEALFTLTGWKKEGTGNITVSEDPKNEFITLSGKTSGSFYYFIENREGLSFAGERLELNIQGSEDCILNNNKLFKLEANNKVAIRPNEAEKINQSDGAYISGSDGTVSFNLPAPLIRLQFVFWDVTLRDLKLSGKIRQALSTTTKTSKEPSEPTPNLDYSGRQQAESVVTGSPHPKDNDVPYNQNNPEDIGELSKPTPTLDYLEKQQSEFVVAESPHLGANDVPYSEIQGDPFPITGWTPWGGITVSEDITNESIVFSGKINSAAGWVIEKKDGLPFAGKVLKLKISGSGNCVLDHQKLFKLEANGIPLTPQEKSRINLNDEIYIKGGDGFVSFKLPSPLTKLQFVFWNATLKDLKLRGILIENDNAI